MIEQGEIYWVNIDLPIGSSPGYRHPCVVIQNNAVNASRIHTVIVCVVTSNLRRADAPGNILLEKHEAGLDRQSVVNVSQMHTVDKTQLDERIGKLSARRVGQIIDGIAVLIEPREIA